MDKAALSMTRQDEFRSRSETPKPGSVSSEQTQSQAAQKGEAVTETPGPHSK